MPNHLTELELEQLDGYIENEVIINHTENLTLKVITPIKAFYNNYNETIHLYLLPMVELAVGMSYIAYNLTQPDDTCSVLLGHIKDNIFD
jgi:hypothetical protein